MRTNDHAIDDLISKQLSPNPKDRLSPAEMREHEAFSRKGVGSQEVRDIIPLAAQLGKLEAKIDFLQAEINKLDRTVENRGNNVIYSNEANNRKMWQDSIDQLSLKKLDLLDRFEQLKSSRWARSTREIM